MNTTCPITLEPIKQIGITVGGNVYEYDAIKKWLNNHNTDPISNELLPSNFVINFGLAKDCNKDNLIYKNKIV